MNSLWDIRIFLGLVPKESPCIRSMPWGLVNIRRQQRFKGKKSLQHQGQAFKEESPLVLLALRNVGSYLAVALA
jgi:hypothetical protein